MTCVVVAVLFIAELAKLHLGTVVAIGFILAMLLLIAALVSFMVEVRVSLAAIHIRPELLEIGGDTLSLSPSGERGSRQR